MSPFGVSSPVHITSPDGPFSSVFVEWATRFCGGVGYTILFVLTACSLLAAVSSLGIAVLRPSVSRRYGREQDMLWDYGHAFRK